MAWISLAEFSRRFVTAGARTDQIDLPKPNAAKEQRSDGFATNVVLGLSKNPEGRLDRESIIETDNRSSFGGA
jgi:hypothetical protein